MAIKYANTPTSLQSSVRINPDPLAQEREILSGKIHVESLILLEAWPCARESDAEIVAGARSLERINRRQARHLAVLAERLGGGGARGVAGRGDARPAAARPDSTRGLLGATGVAAAGESAARRRPATAHVQPDKTGAGRA